LINVGNAALVDQFCSTYLPAVNTRVTTILFSNCAVSDAHVRPLISVPAYPRLRSLTLDACANTSDAVLIEMLKRRLHGLTEFAWRRVRAGTFFVSCSTFLLKFVFMLAVLASGRNTRQVLTTFIELCTNRDKDLEIRRLKQLQDDLARRDLEELEELRRRNGEVFKSRVKPVSEDSVFPDPVGFLRLDLSDLPAECVDSALLIRLLQALPAPPGLMSNGAPPLMALTLERSAGTSAVDIGTVFLFSYTSYQCFIFFSDLF
jgi:hypothetical protein